MDVYRNPASLIERTVRLEEENLLLTKRLAHIRKLEAEVTSLRSRLRRHRAIRGLELIACTVMLMMGATVVTSLIRAC